MFLVEFFTNPVKPESMDRDTSEIAKLTERIAKDPKSKLFVPLAEEYKKSGDIEMSIHVLTEGLKNNPGYVTARSFLGRLLIEKGDLAGAQKEFEEVIKAIPDNLLAQRKLGDVYALLGRPQDALARYKAAVDLSPKDQETIALIADLGAGRDIRDKISKAKLIPPPDQTQKPDRQKEQSAVPAQQAATPVKPVAPKAAKTAPIPAVPPAPEMETAEEVFLVEPLEPEPAVEHEFLTERGAEPLSARPADARPGGLFEEPPSLSIEPGGAEALQAAQPNAAETAAGPTAESLKKSDDFTTDTLAELYISQGFYEKAIDIYERMLAENPGNRKLEEKLTRLHAQAAESGAPETEKSGEEAITAFEQFSPGEAGSAADETAFGGSGREYIPPPAEFEDQPLFVAGSEGRAEPGKIAPFAAPEGEAREYAPPPSEDLEEAPFFGGGFDLSERGPASFAEGERGHEEPEDLIPPADDFAMISQAAPDLGPAEHSLAKPGGPGISDEQAAAKAHKGGRKETISRLEQWLKNIGKEK
jgi:tetratricopeptide (TPR) repeat protein